MNPKRICVGCDTYDDHPKHVVADEHGGEVANHMDCCAAKGCTVCAHQRAGVADSVIGEEFRRHLLGLPALDVVHEANDDDGDPHNLTSATVREA